MKKNNSNISKQLDSKNVDPINTNNNNLEQKNSNKNNNINISNLNNSNSINQQNITNIE